MPPRVGRNSVTPNSETSLKETLVDSEVVFTGKIMRVCREGVRLSNGKIAIREVVRHPGAVAVVPVKDGKVGLVRQYRHAVGRVMLEIPAGKLDRPKESPVACAKRELLEETGLRAMTMTKMVALYTSPGFCNEVIHIFLATQLRVSEAHPDEGEFIRFIWKPMEEAVSLVRRGLVDDAKSAVGILLAANRMGGRL